MRSRGHNCECCSRSADSLCNCRAVVIVSVLALYVDELKEFLHDLPERFQRAAQGRNSVLSKLCKLACYASNQWSVCLDFFCEPNKPVCALFYHREERFTERLPQIAPRILCKLDGVFCRIATGQILVFHATFPCVLPAGVGVADPRKILFQHRYVLCYFRCGLHGTLSEILAHQTDLLILRHGLDAGEEVLDGPDGIILHSLCKFHRVKTQLCHNARFALRGRAARRPLQEHIAQAGCGGVVVNARRHQNVCHCGNGAGINTSHSAQTSNAGYNSRQVGGCCIRVVGQEV